MHLNNGFPQYDFSGRVVAVTGAARGIGEAISARFQQAGAQVWLLDVHYPARDGFQLPLDITQPASLIAARDTILQTSGRLDTLIHCAGFAGPTMPLIDYDPATWRQIVDVNLNGTFEVCRTFVPVLLDQPQSWLVNLASLAGKEGTPNASAYSAAKAGVIALTKSLAKEHAQSGLRVNCITPAAIETPLLAQMTAEHVATMIAKSPQGRLGTVEEVAQMAMWLSSSACTFNSGAAFDLSGGRATY